MAVSPLSESPQSVTRGVVTVLLDGTKSTIEVRPGETVLEAAKRAGLNPPFACEEGNCGTCMARLVEGRVEMRVNDALTDEDVADGYVLTCQSVPQTPSVGVDYV
ncbi:MULTISPECIES: 2Fe-2S iron-sulfur cluster-binding protein [Nocardia]|uniref:2Fe-2S iron-sulfur cluster-binding protein n=1 Tax=Nocardia abscessus TaxID=120957 RepID=UPI001893DA14|nr:2Fe-2S iron-sulfur cluster binding domain-containing protein [Nocardia abscessus]MBF6474623.1 2Fe-2S iron-sulfur cluster binding domain-containing protein [Nocardia abscessus]